jgi:phage terminase Nu1 subunit (DNA packaging protein)
MGGRQLVSKATSGAVKKNNRTKTSAKKVEKKEADKKTETEKVKLLSTEELAQFVGVDVRRIQQLTKEGILKKEPGNQKTSKYNFVRNVHSLLQYYRQKSDSRRSGDSDEMTTAKLEQIILKNQIDELKLKQMEGELHKAEDIEKIIGLMLTRLRTNLLGLPMSMAPILRDMDDVRDIAAKLKERISEIMNEVANVDLQELVKKEEAKSNQENEDT